MCALQHKNTRKSAENFLKYYLSISHVALIRKVRVLLCEYKCNCSLFPLVVTDNCGYLHPFMSSGTQKSVADHAI